MNTGIQVGSKSVQPTMDFMGLANLVNANQDILKAAAVELINSNPRWQKLEDENNAFQEALIAHVKAKMGR